MNKIERLYTLDYFLEKRMSPDQAVALIGFQSAAGIGDDQTLILAKTKLWGGDGWKRPETSADWQHLYLLLVDHLSGFEDRLRRKL